ncbi:MAG TPA: carbon storage regulator CsrA [bacterium]|nr:carbon storage regulator CsrA [bacterium]
MLVLSRKPDESILIGDQIEVVVVEVKGDQVKLGVRAPRSISVHRKEVYEAIQAANLEASKPQVQHLQGLAEVLRKKQEKAPEESAR